MVGPPRGSILRIRDTDVFPETISSESKQMEYRISTEKEVPENTAEKMRMSARIQSVGVSAND